MRYISYIIQKEDKLIINTRRSVITLIEPYMTYVYESPTQYFTLTLQLILVTMLRQPIWKNNNISMATKVKLFQRPMDVNAYIEWRLQALEMKCLRRILKIWCRELKRLIQSCLSTTRPVITLIGCNAVGRASRFFGRQGFFFFINLVYVWHTKVCRPNSVVRNCLM